MIVSFILYTHLCCSLIFFFCLLFFFFHRTTFVISPVCTTIKLTTASSQTFTTFDLSNTWKINSFFLLLVPKLLEKANCLANQWTITVMILCYLVVLAVSMWGEQQEVLVRKDGCLLPCANWMHSCKDSLCPLQFLVLFIAFKNLTLSYNSYHPTYMLGCLSCLTF